MSDTTITDPSASSVTSKACADVDDVVPSDSASTGFKTPALDVSSVDSAASDPPTTIRACQAHVLKLHPHRVALADQLCRGKRLRLIRLIACDLAGHDKEHAQPSDVNCAMAVLCGKHRESYLVHRDFFKCGRRDFYELGVDLIIDSVNVRECRGRLQKRLLTGNPTALGPLSQRSSNIADNRLGPSALAGDVSTPDFNTVAPSPKMDSAISPSSSEANMPELAAIGEGDSLSAPSTIPLGSGLPSSSTFAQNVRSELECLAEKSISADASIWDKQSNLQLRQPEVASTCQSSRSNCVAQVESGGFPVKEV